MKKSIENLASEIKDAAKEEIFTMQSEEVFFTFETKGGLPIECSARCILTGGNRYSETEWDDFKISDLSVNIEMILNEKNKELSNLTSELNYLLS